MLKDFEFLLDYRATDTEAEIFWDLPMDATLEDKYIVVNSTTNETKNIDKTHVTLTGLIPDIEYDVSVYIVCKDQEESKKLLGHLNIRTAKTKKKIDITAAPYNAVGDGKTLNTEAIQTAFDACDKDSFVYIPAGTFLTGALNVHSDSEIYLEEGALLQGTDDPKDYLPKIWSRFEGHEMECYRSLLNLGELDHDADYNCKNVVIRGKGSIMGGGVTLAKDISRTEGGRLRGRLINMSNCQNVWIHGLTLGYGPAWNLHFIYSDQIVTDHCTIKSEGIWNGDGWDPDSSTNSTIYACDFYTEDDSVAIKSGKNPEGNVINRPTKHIRVFDCITNFGHGLCIGSEMSGGVEDIRLWDCEMGPTWSGIEIKATKKRGGYVKNILVRDITASHIQMHSVGYNDDGEGSKVPPLLGDCHFERMHLLGRFLDNNDGKNEWHDCPSILLCGFDVPGYEIKNVSFKDIEMEAPAEDIDSIHTEYCEGVTFENMKSVPRT